ncbi:MAG: hypothetical protein AAF438_23785, partial [Pseudomonadota bacterium]
MDTHGALGNYKIISEDIGSKKTERHLQEDCFCNFFKTPKKNQLFQPPSRLKHPRVEYSRLTQLLGRAMSLGSREWQNTLPTAKTNWENPNIPAGYTYLAQLVAHDIIQTSLVSPSFATAHDAFRNNRSPKLDLDTLYGAHPRAARQAYALSENGDRFRSSLSLGPVTRSSSTVPEAKPELRDIGRSSAPPHDSRGLTEPQLADTRNDNNSNLSQLLTIFIHLHNGIVPQVERLLPDASGLSYVERKERAFADSRQIVERLYRSVVRHDLMKRLLHGD